jgi:uncharacterized SAM-binding protein YcdF (DUF218 family)
MTILPETASATMTAMEIRTEGAIGSDRDPSAATAPKRMARGGRLVVRSTAGRIAIGGAVVVAACLGVFVVGFLWFVTWVTLSLPPADPRADAIVVLTGGRDRVQGAVTLLEEGRGRRLLISGVHPQTRAADIRRATDGDRVLFDCCVDLGHRAESTVGNAHEVADWARDHRFASLIVVTSDYHMPRSMVELDRVLPGVRKIGWPVKRSDPAIETWFAHPATAKLLLHEYVKYIVTRFGPTGSMLRPTEVAAMVGSH